eukprot:785402_1
MFFAFLFCTLFVNIFGDTVATGLDLSRTKEKLHQNGWNETEIEFGINEYETFLFLIKKYPKMSFVPSTCIDEVWHAHILHTKQYQQDMVQYLGYFLHHDPQTNGDKGKGKQMTSVKETETVYEKEFDRIPWIGCGPNSHRIQGKQAGCCKNDD